MIFQQLPRSLTPTLAIPRDRGVFVSAESVGSVIDLTSLVQFSDANTNQRSSLSASNNGVVIAPNLTQLTAVGLTLNANSPISTGQILSLVNSSVVVNNFAADFSNANDLTNATITVNGTNGLTEFSNAAQIDGASLFVNGGGSLSLPAAISYANSIDDIWRAEGVGSVLSLPNLTSITNGDGRDWDMTINARTGGRIDLPAVTSIIDPNTGDTRDRGVFVSAESVGSVIDLTSLVQFSDANTNQRSSLSASNNGVVIAPNLTQLTAVGLTLNANSPISTGQILSLVNSSVVVNNFAADFSNANDLTNATITVNGTNGLTEFSNAAQIDGASLFVNGGGSLSLPAAISYANSIDDIWRAEGVGSVLSLPNLTSITNGDGRDWDMTINARTGGRIDLPAVTSIIDPNTGDTRDRGVFVSAENEGSLVVLVSLSLFSDANTNQRSSITVSDGASIDIGSSLTSLQLVDVTVAQASSLIGSLSLENEARLFGQGIVDGNLTNNFVFSPGRTFEITGDYLQGVSGVLTVDVAGALASEFDFISIAGNASFGGTLTVNLEGGFTPSVGDPIIEVIVYSSTDGAFNTINDGGYQVIAGGTSVMLVAPSAFTGSGGGGSRDTLLAFGSLEQSSTFAADLSSNSSHRKDFYTRLPN